MLEIDPNEQVAVDKDDRRARNTIWTERKSQRHGMEAHEVAGRFHTSRLRDAGSMDELMVFKSKRIPRMMGSVLFRLLRLKPEPGSSRSLLDSVSVVQLKFSLRCVETIADRR